MCKRQLTWLRAMPGRIVIDCCAPDGTEQALHALEQVFAAADWKISTTSSSAFVNYARINSSASAFERRN
jgi:hypothetical protein